MDERKRLFKKLQQQVESIMPAVNRAEINASNAFIGKVEINIKDFTNMKYEFEEIINLPYETKISKMQYGFIPIALCNQNTFFKTIQITLNAIRKEQMKAYQENEEER